MKLKEIALGVALFATLFTVLAVCGTADYETAKAEEEWEKLNSVYVSETETEIQPELEQAEYEADCYEIRICEAYNWGQILYDTTNGNLFSVQDPPEFTEGQLVSVLFDNKGTVDPTDDEIIDLWEFE